MIEFFERIDQRIVLSINGLHSPILDEIMWFISGKLPWIPFYVYLIFLAYKKISLKHLIVFILIAICCIAFSDLICTYAFKEVFQRYRPSHNLLLFNKLHLYEEKPGQFYAGGEYGFISSHAANFFAIAAFVGLVLKQYYPNLIKWILLIATIVSLSRVYLGVHYLSDIIIGGFVGFLMGYIFYRFVYLKFTEKVL